jgi:hypothetical protein
MQSGRVPNRILRYICQSCSCMPDFPQFDAAEKTLMFDAGLFERKRRVNQKIFELFENIRLALKDSAQHKQFLFPEGTDYTTGKIAQGENYLGYPWVMLDFPRGFKKNAMFAYRTMFWYGHYFSVSLLISGDHLSTLLPGLASKLRPAPDGLLFATHGDAWCHDLDASTFLPANQLSTAAIMEHGERHGYIKLSIKLDEPDMKKLSEQVVAHYEMLLQLLL